MKVGNSQAWRELAYIVAAAALAILVAVPALANGFAYDDIPIAQLNPRVTESHSFWWHLHQGYWPSLLYRPLTIWLMSLEWRVGGGLSWIFHFVNMLLAGVASALVYRLARAWFTPAVAFLTAALFAIHPVHVEAVANIVGQSELLATIAVLTCVALFVEAGKNGPAPGRRALIALSAALGALAKENAFVLPGLLALAGLVAPPERGLRERWRTLKPTMLTTTASVLGILAIRAAVLSAAVGEDPAVTWRGLSAFPRMVAMLGVVPEWVRLLLWPAHLAAEYGPPELGLPDFGLSQVLGIVCLILSAALAWGCRRRASAVTFGILWAAIALVPVSNLVATGIVLAERTLFMPSAGAMIAVVGLGSLVVTKAPQRAVRLALAAAACVLVIVGGWRSAQRAKVWESNQTVFTAGVVDAPRSYRAWRMLGLHMQSELRWDAAETAFRRSLMLWNRDPSVQEALGLTLVQQGRCIDAIPVLEQGIALDSSRSFGRARLYFCQRKAGDWDGARETAAGGLAHGDSSFAPLVHSADSALSLRRAGSASAGLPPRTPTSRTAHGTE